MGDNEVDVEGHADIHELYALYNALYFDGALGACSVQWSSPRMTLCAGTCEFERGCRIKLSAPILQYRSNRDLKETLLHEMIHALIFLTSGGRDTDRDGHGAEFLSHMNRINRASATGADPEAPPGGYNISVYHSFTDEVEVHRVHAWICSRCGDEVRRAMNRAPSDRDCFSYRTNPAQRKPCRDAGCRWHTHAVCCGGEYVKVAGPEPPAAKAGQKRATRDAAESSGGPGKKTGVRGGPTEQSRGLGLADLWARASAAQGAAGGASTAAAGAEDGPPMCPVCCMELSRDVVAQNEHVDRCLLGV